MNHISQTQQGNAIEGSIARDALGAFLAETLQIAQHRDYCPNGLQVEGRASIRRIVTGVTACYALLEAAAAWQADAILVHHGYFWRNEDPRLIGMKHRRLQVLFAHDINLFAYHLPLDAHPTLGNNAQLAKRLSFLPDAAPAGRFGENGIGWLGSLAAPGVRTVGELAQHIAQQLGRTPQLIGDPDQVVGKIAWCTGAAHTYLPDAIAAGASVYLSGEIAEPTVHLARESGVAYLACGHHATERYGIAALGEAIAEKYGVEHRFVDIDNPV